MPARYPAARHITAKSTNAPTVYKNLLLEPFIPINYKQKLLDENKAKLNN
jgi:hypothetical protein